jgi:hypothetical protein
VNGEREAIRVYVKGSVHITFEGFVISNAHPSYTCPNGRESYYLIHLQDASDVTLRGNAIFGNNAPGRCNELLKINRSDDGIYGRNVVIRGNVFYDSANAGGSDMIDAVRPGEVHILENIFFGNPEKSGSHSFITLKRQAPDDQPSSPRYRVSRNVFLNWGGKSDQAFVQFGEDGVDFLEITDVLVDNNLVIGNSPASLAAPFQFKGAAGIRVVANTIVGDLPSGSFGFRIGTEGSNPPVSGFDIRNNLWSDPTGTMGSRLVNTYGGVDVSSIVLDRNLYWNGGQALPTGGSVTPSDDAHQLHADPLVGGDQSAIVLPRWDESSAFPSGSKSIREEFLRLVETYGALGAGSPAIDAADAAHMPSEDIRGYARDGSPDLGAYEWGAQAGGSAGSAGQAGVGGSSGAGASGGTAGSGASGGSAGTAGGAGGSGGSGGTGGAADAGSGVAAAGGASASSDDDGGCGCRIKPASFPSSWLLALFGAISLAFVRYQAGTTTRARRATPTRRPMPAR